MPFWDASHNLLLPKATTVDLLQRSLAANYLSQYLVSKNNTCFIKAPRTDCTHQNTLDPSTGKMFKALNEIGKEV